MEKFNRWSDLQTGIHPFVPRQGGILPNRVLRYLYYACNGLLTVVRLVAIGLVVVLFGLTNGIGSGLSWIPGIGRGYRRVTEWCWCRLILWCCSVRIVEERANLRRLGLPGTSSKRSRIQPGDVIVCNSTNVLEMLYLTMRYSPVFTMTTEVDAGKGLVQRLGVGDAFLSYFRAPTTVLQKPQKLHDVIQSANAPVVVFPEGTRSNGKGILKFLPVLNDLMGLVTKEAPLRVHVIAFRYDKQGFAPTHTTGTGWQHLFWCCFHWLYSMHVIVLGQEHVPRYPSQQSRLHREKDAIGNILPQTPMQWTERIRGLLAGMVQTKTIDLSVADFLSFQAYWNHVTTGGKLPASKFTTRKAPHEHAQWKK